MEDPVPTTTEIKEMDSTNLNKIEKRKYLLMIIVVTFFTNSLFSIKLNWNNLNTEEARESLQDCLVFIVL